MASFWDESQSAARLTCKDEVLFLAAARWDTLSSLDVWSSEMSHFEKQQKVNIFFCSPPVASHWVSVFLPLRLCVCLRVPLPLSFLGTCGVGNVLERERGWVGMLDLLHLPFGKLEPGRSNGTQQGRGRENRWTEHQNRRDKPSPYERALAHTHSNPKGYCGRL